MKILKCFLCVAFLAVVVMSVPVGCGSGGKATKVDPKDWKPDPELQALEAAEEAEQE